jgi:hypothetical protein
MNSPQFALDLGHAAAQQAAKAQDDRSPLWSTSAWEFFVAWAQERRGSPFMGEDVRHASRGIVEAPIEPRAWGAIILRASKLGLIRCTGYAQAKDPKSHGNPKSVWKWVG